MILSEGWWVKMSLISNQSDKVNQNAGHEIASNLQRVDEENSITLVI